MKGTISTLLLSLVIISFEGLCQPSLIKPPILGKPSSPGGNPINVYNSLFDGSATISIPFYSAVIEGANFNLSAYYNTKGIKVNQKASAIGLGWELSCGYSISRTVKDRPDEKYIPEYSWTGLSKNYSMIGGCWYSSPGPVGPFDVGEYYEATDHELDRFQLNLNGRNVEFYFSKWGNLVTIPRANLKIDRIINNVNTSGSSLTPITGTLSSETDLSFVVTDEAGTKYYFSWGTYHREFLNKYAETASSSPSYGYFSNSYIVIDEWKIDKIITYNNQEILFDYDRYEIVDKVLNKLDYITEQSGVFDFGATAETITVTRNVGVSMLTKITLPNNERIEFVHYGREDESHQLAYGSIDIISNYNNGSTVLHENKVSYMFNYAYFNAIGSELSFDGIAYSYYGSRDDIRLKLNSIDKVAGSTFSRYYTFSYNMSVNLPSKFSQSQDLFGYYNGKSPVACVAFSPAVYSGVPYHNVRGTGTGAGDPAGMDKSPDPIYTQANILTSVKNEAGAKTEFTYGGCSNCLSASTSFPSSPATVVAKDALDGVYVLQKLEHDGYSQDNDILTVYDYGAGKSFLPGGMFYYITKYSTSPGVDRYVYMSSCLSSSYQINGSNHGFSSVLSTQYKRSPSAPGGWGMLNKMKQSFTNTDQNLGTTNVTTNVFVYPTSSPKYWEPPFSDKQYYRQWGLGLPTVTENYDINGNLTSKQEVYYTFSDESLTFSQYNSTKYLTSIIHNDPSSPSTYGRTSARYTDDYGLMTGNVFTTKIKSQTFTPTGPITTISDIEYDSYNNVMTKKVDNSNGETLINKIYYNYSWSPFPSSSNSAINKMNADGLMLPIYSELWKKKGAQETIVDNSGLGMAILSGRIVPKYRYSLLSKNGLPSSTYGTFPSAFNMVDAASGATITNFKKTNETEDFDFWGNERSIIGAGNVFSANFYNGPKHELIASIKNSKLQEAAFTSFEWSYKNKGVADENKGNWDFDNKNIKFGSLTTALPVSGNLIYELNSSTSAADIATTGSFSPTIGKKYQISFWTNGGKPVVTNSGAPLVITPVGLSYRGWVLYTCEFNATGNINISGVGGTVSSGGTKFYIDEIRLYPADALMQTVTYEPLFGVKSSCDENNRFSINEYDGFGRIVLTRDHNGNIISKNKYTIQGAD